MGGVVNGRTCASRNFTLVLDIIGHRTFVTEEERSKSHVCNGTSTYIFKLMVLQRGQKLLF